MLRWILIYNPRFAQTLKYASTRAAQACNVLLFSRAKGGQDMSLSLCFFPVLVYPSLSIYCHNLLWYFSLRLFRHSNFRLNFKVNTRPANSDKYIRSASSGLNGFHLPGEEDHYYTTHYWLSLHSGSIRCWYFFFDVDTFSSDQVGQEHLNHSTEVTEVILTSVLRS